MKHYFLISTTTEDGHMGGRPVETLRSLVECVFNKNPLFKILGVKVEYEVDYGRPQLHMVSRGKDG